MQGKAARQQQQLQLACACAAGMLTTDLHVAGSCCPISKRKSNASFDIDAVFLSVCLVPHCGCCADSALLYLTSIPASTIEAACLFIKQVPAT
jgi:hypothetical protein